LLLDGLDVWLFLGWLLFRKGLNSHCFLGHSNLTLLALYIDLEAGDFNITGDALLKFLREIHFLWIQTFFTAHLFLLDKLAFGLRTFLWGRSLLLRGGGLFLGISKASTLFLVVSIALGINASFSASAFMSNEFELFRNAFLQ
jgi:hypothetical protein